MRPRLTASASQGLPQAVQREAQGDELERAQRERDDAVGDLEVALRHSSRSHAAAATMRRGAAIVVRTRLPVASCRRTITSPEPSSATFTASTSAPCAVTVTAGAGALPHRARHAPDTTRNGRSRRSASIDDVGEAGAVGEQRQRHLVMAVVGARIRVLGGPGERTRTCDPGTAPIRAEQPVAIAPVVQHRDAEVRLGDVDVAVRAHFELGRVPRRRRVRRPLDRTELDAAARGVGVHVEREHHRQQVLVVMPVERDLDVEARRPRPQDIAHGHLRRAEHPAHRDDTDQRSAFHDGDGLGLA